MRKASPVVSPRGRFPATTLFLDLSRVQVGDILQTRGRGTTSRAIALFSRGLYSHVAIFTSSLALFESLDDGVGDTYLFVDRGERRGGGAAPRLLSALLSGAKPLRIARVLRPHPWVGLSDARRYDLADDLAEALGTYWGLAYPSWGALIPAARAIPAGSLRRIIADLAHRADKGPQRPGPFCSQVIALALRKMRVRVCTRQPANCELAPNDFEPGKFFVEVPDAVVTADPTAELAYTHAELDQVFPNNAFIRKHGERPFVTNWVKARERLDALLSRLK